jgi:hypothetical protein
MKKYKRHFPEQEYKSWLNANHPDDEVMGMIGRLRDERFASEEQRQQFIKIITQLALSNDAEARRFIRELGNWCSNYMMKHEKEV